MVPSANQIAFYVVLGEAEGTGELITTVGAVILGTVVLTLWLCRRPTVKHSVVLLPSGLRVSHGC